jgi:hypothetical protein
MACGAVVGDLEEVALAIFNKCMAARFLGTGKAGTGVRRTNERSHQLQTISGFDRRQRQSLSGGSIS